MKNCEKCNKKIKNGFKLCYSCNDNKSETSEPEIDTPKPFYYIKDAIPRAVKTVFGSTISDRNVSVNVLVANVNP